MLAAAGWPAVVPANASAPTASAHAHAPATLPLDPQPQVDPLSLDGREFAGVRFRLEPVGGTIDLEARRAHAWQSGSTRRLFLDGDVRVSLPGHDLYARRAAVWFERIDAGIEAGGGVYQVFVFMEQVGNAGADPELALEARHLSVEAVVRVIAPVTLRADKPFQGEPPARTIRDGELALAAHLRRLVGGRPSAPFTPGPVRVEDVPPIAIDRALPPARRDAPIFARQGVISAAAGQVKVVTEAGRTAVLLSGGIHVAYEDRASGRTLLMEGAQGVVFLRGERLGDPTRYTTDDVEGIYLEGAVAATDGNYSIRADEIYYDLAGNRAMVLRAVFWTYDERIRLPVYVRADAIRQVSSDQFVAERAAVSTTAFFEPHLSIGASSITITRTGGTRPHDRPPAPGDEPEPAGVLVDARNIVLRAGSVPFFYWPIFQGDPSKIPIRSLVFHESSATGAALKTTWRLKTMLGDSLPTGVDGDLLLDWYFERGPALGTELAFGWADAWGEALLYALPRDVGRDRVQNGARFERDGEFRGIATARHTWLIDQSWTARIEAAHVSDETFVPVFFPALGRTSDELTNRLVLARRDDHSLLLLEASGSFNDFLVSESQLQSTGFGVDRLPEARYLRLADDVLHDHAPGALLYDSEYRLGALALNFDSPLARERGYAGPQGANRAFGILPGQSIADRLRAEGYNESVVFRFDTRQELSAHADLAGIIVNPFVVGRLTAWDDDFDEFAPAAADENVRLWGAIGARASTTLVRIDDDVASRTFDLHRLRHIIVPSVTLWHAGTTIDHAHLPAYDSDVESIAEGSALKLAVEQAFQTQRGGPGRNRSVDVLKLDTALVLASGDTDPDSPIGRFFDSRPELSNLGDFAQVDAVWQATEVFAVTGSAVYDLDRHGPARETLGYVIDHSPDFSTYGELRYLNALDSTYMGFGATYRFTPKYSASGWIVLDAVTGEARNVSLELVRRYPTHILRLGVFHNAEADDTGFGLAIQPTGVPDAEARLRGVGSTSIDQRSSRLGGG